MKRNRSTKAILAAYDTQNGYTVISFKDNLRVMTYSHLDPIFAIDYVQRQNQCGHECLVFRDTDLSGMDSISRDKAFFVNRLESLRDKANQLPDASEETFENNPKGQVCKLCARFEWDCKCYPVKCARANCNCEYSHN